MVYPDLLAPTPAAAIVRFEPDTAAAPLEGGFPIPRGTRLLGRIAPGDQTRCTFSTAHEVTLWPITVAEARYVTGSALGSLGLEGATGRRRLWYCGWRRWANSRSRSLRLIGCRCTSPATTGSRTVSTRRCRHGRLGCWCAAQMAACWRGSTPGRSAGRALPMTKPSIPRHRWASLGIGSCGNISRCRSASCSSSFPGSIRRSAGRRAPRSS